MNAHIRYRCIAVAGAAGLMALSASRGSADDIFRTGFELDETPPYLLGDLNGQNGWQVAPMNASGLVQGAFVFNGVQAAEIIDGASFGRAQQNIATADIGPTLVSSVAMYVSTEWAAIPSEVLDRFEAQERLEFTDAQADTWGLEFGFITTSTEYNTLEPGDSALYIELTRGDVLEAFSYVLVQSAAPMLDNWHVFELVLDIATGQVRLFVDGIPTGSIVVPADLTAVSVLQIQNQRWGTNPNQNASLYFDDLCVSRQTSTTQLADMNVAFGYLISGGLEELLASDDLYVRMRSHFGFSSLEPNVMDLYVGAATTVAAPALLDLVIESRLNTPGGRVRIRLHNWDSDVFEEVHQYLQGTVDRTEFISDIGAANYVRSTDGRIELSIRQSVIIVFSSAGFDSYIDQVQMTAR